MGRIFISLSILFSAGFVHAGQISMYENGYPINVMPIQKVVVTSKVMLTIYSYVRPCPSYPKNVDGDVYVCKTSTAQLGAYLNDTEIAMMDGEFFKSYLINQNITISCNAEVKPQLIQYDGKNIYDFDGPLFTPKQ